MKEKGLDNSMKIKLLDCTLRDGGHQITSNFGASVIDSLTRGLEKAKVDCIEIGFLKDGDYSDNVAVYNNMADVYAKTKQLSTTSEYTLLVQEDQFDIDNLEPYNGGVIKRIRVSFHEFDKVAGVEFCRKIVEKGYLCHMNPINLPGYSDEEILDFVKIANELSVAAFSIVDTFGALTKDSLLRIFYLINNNLKSEIDIGLHLHENLRLSFSLAQTLAEVFPENRTLVIDASLLGMGRDPGNLCIELIADWLNKKFGSGYDVDALLDLIDEYIYPIKLQAPWGYATAYALSAQYNLHRSYGEYLMKKGKIRTKEIRHILTRIPKEQKSHYNEKFVEQLYQDYLSVSVDDESTIKWLSEKLKDQEVLIMAPGKTIRTHEIQIQNYITENKPIVIAVNFDIDVFPIDYVFCSNAKRFERITRDGVIVTSNIATESGERGLKVVYQNNLAHFDTEFWDNSVLMIFNLLRQCGVKNCAIAGFDGFSGDGDFADKSYESAYGIDWKSENIRVKKMLQSVFNNFGIEFITPSAHQ
jgi:4-hydroxy 2-oxovalerate aldolase